jgi:SNF2 family DNA or RNA helicase
LIDSPVADNFISYIKEFCGGVLKYGKNKRKYWAYDKVTEETLENLYKFTKDKILRRTKEQHLKHLLPEKYRNLLIIPKEYSPNYNEYIEQYRAEIKLKEQMGETPGVLEKLTMLVNTKKLLAIDKTVYTIQEIEKRINKGEKVIVFSCFTESLKIIYNHFKNIAVYIDGSVHKSKRSAIVDEFQQNDKIQVFCGNIVAAGVGLTLTKADAVYFNDLDWLPSNHWQAEDRSYRLGRKEDVFTYYVMVSDTLDIDIYDLLISKQQTINQVIREEDNLKTDYSKILKKIE